jgi:hypothetical protein
MDTMTSRQAFEAMVWFVKQFQDRGPFEDTGLLLQALSHLKATDTVHGGIDLWKEWRLCAQKALQFTGLPEEFPLAELAKTSWDEQGGFPDTLTVVQAFEATHLFLYRQYLKTKDPDGGVFYLMSNMDLGVWTNHMTADPAYWYDWMASVQKVLLPDTLENQQLVQDLITHQENYLGNGAGGEWYAHLLPDGRQLWAVVYGGKLLCAGIRETPVAFDPEIGLSTPQHP